MALSEDTNGSGPLLQPWASRSLKCILKTATGSNQANGKVYPTLTKKFGVDGGATRCQRILVSCFTWTPLGDLVHQISLTFIALVRSSKLTIYVCSCFFTLLNYLDCECKLVHQSQFWKQTLSHIQTLWLCASSESQNIDRGSSSRSPSRRTQLRCSMPLFGLSGKFHPS